MCKHRYEKSIKLWEPVVGYPTICNNLSAIIYGDKLFKFIRFKIININNFFCRMKSNPYMRILEQGVQESSEGARDLFINLGLDKKVSQMNF